MYRTNFNKKDLGKYQLAITEFKRKTGSNRLSIEEKAYDNFGRLMPNKMVLHDNEKDSDLTLFWLIYRNIEENGNRIMFENMQYYMEYCLSNDYVTPMEWLSKYKHY